MSAVANPAAFVHVAIGIRHAAQAVALSMRKRADVGLLVGVILRAMAMASTLQTLCVCSVLNVMCLP